MSDSERHGQEQCVWGGGVEAGTLQVVSAVGKKGSQPGSHTLT